MAPQVFVMFYLFLIPTNSENLTYLASMIQKLKIFDLPFEGIPQTWHPQFQAGTSTSGYL